MKEEEKNKSQILNSYTQTLEKGKKFNKII